MFRKLMAVGKAEASSRSDQVEVGIRITDLAHRATSAQENVARKTHQVVNLLLGLGVQKEQLQTTSY